MLTVFRDGISQDEIVIRVHDIIQMSLSKCRRLSGCGPIQMRVIGRVTFSVSRLQIRCALVRHQYLVHDHYDVGDIRIDHQ
jgi:hypothetical protein